MTCMRLRYQYGHNKLNAGSGPLFVDANWIYNTTLVEIEMNSAKVQ